MGIGVRNACCCFCALMVHNGTCQRPERDGRQRVHHEQLNGLTGIRWSEHESGPTSDFSLFSFSVARLAPGLMLPASPAVEKAAAAFTPLAGLLVAGV